MGSHGDNLSGSALTVAEVINLRMARKAKARDAATRQAEVNRAKHGQTRAERSAQRIDAERAARQLDASKRERPE